MQPKEPTIAAYQNPLGRYFAATRPAFLSASLLSCLIGLATARHGGISLSPELVAISLMFGLMAHAGVNVLNDYYDALNGTDACNVERVFPFTGGSRFIQNRVLTLAQTARFGFTLLFCVVVAGIWLMLRSTTQLFYIGSAGLFIGWAYSAPPFRLNSRGLGEVCVTAGFLLITVGTDFVQRKGFATAPIIAGLSYALLVTNLLYINQFPDRKADSAVGKLHWVARLDVQQARWGYVLIVALANGWLVLSVILGWLPLLALTAGLALPLSIKAARQLFRYAAHPQHLSEAIRLTIFAMLLHGLLLTLSLFIR